MPAATTPSATDRPVEFMTVFVPTPKVSASAIFPYVQAAIEAVGVGSALTVGDTGIQLTVPVQLLHYLQSMIRGYNDSPSGVPAFAENVFYPPVLKATGVTVPLKTLVDSLQICPPDMAVQWLKLSDTVGALVVSGPPGRLAYYRDSVLPNLKALLVGLSSNPPFAGSQSASS